ncbi:MAG TPA: histidine kinase [Streptosporangiaceae bacterium]
MNVEAAAATPTLAALRRARAQREVARRRFLPIGLLAVAIVAVVAARSKPGPGLHGDSLLVLLGIIVFSGSATIAIAEAVLPTMPRLSALAHVGLMAAIMLGSGVLLWLQPDGPGLLGLFIAVGMAARLAPGALGAALAVGALAFLLVADVAGLHSHRTATGLASILGLVAVYTVVVLGRRLRSQDDQAERLLLELEQARGAELRAVALAERQRLAREMHDVLAHSLSGLLLQLEGARLLSEEGPAEPRLTSTIDRAHHLAKQGLGEARRAIAMLRDDELPGPGQLPALAAEFERDTGVRCTLRIAGSEPGLGSQAKLALYRVAQEALTNVRRHSRPDRVEVHLGYQPHAATLVVEDFAAGAEGVAQGGPAAGGETAPPAGQPGSGYGLTGMRERAELLGGTLSASPTPAGFRVELMVPA